jgi:MFS family permease
VMGACAVVSSLLAAAVAHRLRRRPVFLIGFLVAGAPRFVVLAFDLPLWLIIGVHAVAGLGSGFLNPILGAIQFERTPRELFGRVRTLVVAVAWSGIPFGGLIGGGLIALVGVAPAAVAAGTAYLVTTAAAGLRKEWADMDRRRRLPGGG